MSLEQVTQTSETAQLFEDIIKAEKAELSSEYLPMWNAENNACFPHFINYAKEEFENIISSAMDGDIESIDIISIEYQKYRNGIEADLMEFSPEIYDLYIEAVGNGDSEKAISYMNEYINQAIKETVDEDDDD